MEFINNIEINKHEVIKDRGKHFAEALDGEDKEVVLSIVRRSENYLKNVGNQDNVVYSPTKREMATFTVSFKRYVNTDFIEPAVSNVKTYCPESNTDWLCDKCILKHISQYQSLPDLCESCEEQYLYLMDLYKIQWERKEIIYSEFEKARESTIIPDELIGNWLLLMRKMREDKESKDIDKALKEFIRDELINEFKKQNKQLLKKYQLWQNQ